ncbi:Piso0_001561 [Millerozyma farinosa CBS 7064]|uniref:Piso0_001561 protein n=1 Tax=Pichia sorbitophila (strain ATCC MYA-4447 / BCRC 22081 / CBS 7064 / NBRC 10061 / NRRL Y-12695) TaxID=559304 RepID=G8YNH7_PICSO|nr:Piso0_001561 [Millerozyma farinosa CBS 7064]
MSPLPTHKPASISAQPLASSFLQSLFARGLRTAVYASGPVCCPPCISQTSFLTLYVVCKCHGMHRKIGPRHPEQNKNSNGEACECDGCSSYQNAAIFTPSEQRTIAHNSSLPLYCCVCSIHPIVLSSDAFQVAKSAASSPIEEQFNMLLYLGPSRPLGIHRASTGPRSQPAGLCNNYLPWNLRGP